MEMMESNRKSRKEIKRTLLTASAGLHIREANEGETSRVIAGYAILFGVESAPLWSDEDSEAREVIDAAAITQDLLDASDIKFTMFHDRQLILARSNKGSGTLTYRIDEKGVYFEFEAPKTADGDKAVELVKRGDLSGCSFAFTTHYWDDAFVERSARCVGDQTVITYRVKAITGIYDFTLAADPAYPDTSVEAREFLTELRDEKNPGNQAETQKTSQQSNISREIVKKSIFFY